MVSLYLPTDRRTYWAAEQDPEIATRRIRERIEGYGEQLQASRWVRRMMRSWKYYHGMYFDGAIDLADAAIKYLGDQGELAGLAVNDFRSLIDQIVGLVTRNFPSYSVRAINSDLASLHQSRLGEQLMEAYKRDKKLDDYLKMAALHALIFNVGYVHTYWDKYSGDEYDAQPIFPEQMPPESMPQMDEYGIGGGDGPPVDMQQPEMQPQEPTGYDITRSGDVQYCNPTVFDVAFDPTESDWNKIQWVAVRLRENKYDLAARFQEIEEEILSQDLHDTDQHWLLSLNATDSDLSDKIDVWHFYHLPSPALPEGRYLCMVGETALPGTEMQGLQYRELPIDRCVAGELLGTCFGYSPALDMQGPQEALNATESTAVSNQRSNGIQRWWVRDGEELNDQRLKDGSLVVRSNTKPEPLVGSVTSPEILAAPEHHRRNLELLSGINSVRRGAPEGGLKSASGSAFALLDAKSVESWATFSKSYRGLVSGVGTKTLRYLNDFPLGKKTAIVMGKHNRSKQLFIERDSLNLIDRVIVEDGNPFLDSTSGRLHLFELLLSQKYVTAEEGLTFLRTGEKTPMLEAAEAQLDLIRQENEDMLEGTSTHLALAIDNHELHVREHAALLNSTEARSKPGFTEVVLAAIMQHMQAMQDPAAVMHALVAGYPTPLAGMNQGLPGEPFAGQTPMPGAMAATGEAADAAEANYPQMPEQATTPGMAAA